jgi:hypothetical protein
MHGIMGKLKESSETEPSFITAEVRKPRRLPCDATCVRSIMMHYGNMEIPLKEVKTKAMLTTWQATHRVRTNGSACQVQCYTLRQSRQ